MKKLLVIFVCIFTIVAMGSCANTSATFDVKTVTLDGKIEWSGEDKTAFFPASTNICYLDDDSTIVALWCESSTDVEKSQFREYLLRISPDGSYSKTLIYDSGTFNLRDKILNHDSLGVYKNPRGNTVVCRNVVNSDTGNEEWEEIYSFDEYDYDFNRVDRVEYNDVWRSYKSPYFASMDDNGYIYAGSETNVTVYSPDFKYLGEVTGLPKVKEDAEYNTEIFVPVTGGDGAVYIYKYADEEPRSFYKVAPQTLKAKKVFTLSADKTDYVWRGDMQEGALFYTAGKFLGDKYDEGYLIKIGKSGFATKLMGWEEAGIGIEFSDEEYNLYTFQRVTAQLSHNGNFYALNTVYGEDGDEVIKLISFIRNWE
jgi:hypothetical protein